MEAEIIDAGKDADEKNIIRNILHYSTLPSPWNEKINFFTAHEKAHKNKDEIIKLIIGIRANRNALIDANFNGKWIDNIIEGLSTDVARMAIFANTIMINDKTRPDDKKEQKKDDKGTFSRAAFPSDAREFSGAKNNRKEEENLESTEVRTESEVIIIGGSMDDNSNESPTTYENPKISNDDKEKKQKKSSTFLATVFDSDANKKKIEPEEVSDFDDLLPSSSSNVHYYSTGECYPK